MAEYLTLTPDTLPDSHICCAFSDKKCGDSYQAKKDWLKRELTNGYVFRRLDARAKVFIEYGPAETAWLPIHAPNYLNLNCFWVSGKYKKQGHGKALLQSAWEDAEAQGKSGLVTVVGTKKLHFLSDTKWLLKQGFEVADQLAYGFSLLVKKLDPEAPDPQFRASVQTGELPDSSGIVVYYSNRCPFAEFHARESLVDTAEKRKLPLKIIKLETMEQAQAAPSPATIFSLFLDGKYLTNDLSICIDNRFDQVLERARK